jgi:hypothetical protein
MESQSALVFEAAEKLHFAKLFGLETAGRFQQVTKCEKMGRQHVSKMVNCSTKTRATSVQRRSRRAASYTSSRDPDSRLRLTGWQRRHPVHETA